MNVIKVVFGAREHGKNFAGVLRRVLGIAPETEHRVSVGTMAAGSHPGRSRHGAAGLSQLWLAVLTVGLLLGPIAGAGDATAKPQGHGAQKWVATWAASAHGPYPFGSPVAQPDLSFAFPDPEVGARNQTFRLIIRPTVWSDEFRLRFSNAFGDRPQTLDGVFLGLQQSSGKLVADSNRRVTFNGSTSVVIPAGEYVYSDAVELDYLNPAKLKRMKGRKLAVSFHVAGTSGPMTWHAKAMQTSYVTAPGAGSHGHEEGDQAFPYSSASWYFLDAVDAMGPANASVVVALGDSITDGTGSTLNGDDRYPDFLARRLQAAFGDQVSVVNAGIGGNRVLTPDGFDPDNPTSGGPSALSRLQRDVFSLSGVTAVLWMEGINDLGSAGATADEVIAGIREGVEIIRAQGLKIVQGTLPSALNSPFGDYGTAQTDAHRRAINEFIRTAGIFDGVVDFDAATINPETGELRDEFKPNSTTAFVDNLHPNRAGYMAMGNAVDLDLFAPMEREHARGKSDRAPRGVPWRSMRGASH